MAAVRVRVHPRPEAVKLIAPRVAVLALLLDERPGPNSRCHYSRYTGEAARYCFEEALERTKFVGESTLGQLLEHILLYMNRSHNEWPLYIDDPFVRPRHATRAMQGAGEDVDDEALLRGQHSHWSGEFHGMPLVQESALRQLRAYKPRALVMLQGANDAARDSISVFEGRLRTYLGDLKARTAEPGIHSSRFRRAPSRSSISALLHCDLPPPTQLALSVLLPHLSSLSLSAPRPLRVRSPGECHGWPHPHRALRLDHSPLAAVQALPRARGGALLSGEGGVRVWGGCMLGFVWVLLHAAAASA